MKQSLTTPIKPIHPLWTKISPKSYGHGFRHLYNIIWDKIEIHAIPAWYTGWYTLKTELSHALANGELGNWFHMSIEWYIQSYYLVGALVLGDRMTFQRPAHVLVSCREFTTLPTLCAYKLEFSLLAAVWCK